jgi:hypothetical protein
MYENFGYKHNEKVKKNIYKLVLELQSGVLINVLAQADVKP